MEKEVNESPLPGAVIIKQGAEGRIYEGTFLGRPTLVKVLLGFYSCSFFVSPVLLSLFSFPVFFLLLFLFPFQTPKKEKRGKRFPLSPSWSPRRRVLRKKGAPFSFSFLPPLPLFPPYLSSPLFLLSLPPPTSRNDFQKPIDTQPSM